MCFYLVIGALNGLGGETDLLLGFPDSMHCSRRACSASGEPSDSKLIDDSESRRDDSF